MADQTVVGIRPDVIIVAASRKDQFIQHVAEAFDSYVRTNGEEPDAMLFVMGGVAQTTESSWLIEGLSDQHPNNFVAMAASHIASNAVRFDSEED